MSEQMTLKQVGVDLRKMGEDGQWSWTLVPFADAIDAHLAQHAQMVASFQKLYARIPVGPCSQVALDVKTILDAEPADPAKADLVAVRKVIIELRQWPANDRLTMANKLCTAIGDSYD